MKNYWKKNLVILFVALSMFFIYCDENDDDSDGDEASESDDDDNDDDDNTTKDLCPEGMAYVPGGMTTVLFQGPRWGTTQGEFYTETQWVDPFCIDTYEASLPDATSTSMGTWEYGFEVQPALSQPDVLPWVEVSWEEASLACEKVGKQILTLAQWQTAFSGLEGNIWPWGNEWEDHGCYLNMEHDGYPTGGCCFRTCDSPQCGMVCDMVGNVSEWVADYWDEDCYGEEQVMIAGGSAHQPHEFDNQQEEDPNNSGCWRFADYCAKRFGLHHHNTIDGFGDDGFRCAMAIEN